MVLTDGEGDAEARAAAGTRLVRDDSAGRRDDPVADRQTEARPARLGGEERGEEVALRVLGNSRAVVGDRHRQELVPMRSPADVVARLDAGHDGELSPAAKRLDGVLHQVEKDLRE